VADVALMDTEYLQYCALDIISRALPRRFAYAVGRAIAGAMFAGDAKGRPAVISNLRRILTYKGLTPTDEELEGLALETYRNFSKYLVDFFKLRRMSREAVETIVTVENVQYYEEAFSLGRSAIALSVHISTWEMALLETSSRGYPVNLVYFPMKSKKTAELFRKRREERGAKTIPLGAAAGAVLGAFRRKEWVALAGDVDFSPHDDLIEFFGAPARMPIGPAKLCVGRKVPILPGFVVRKPDDTFVLRLHPPIIPNESTTVEEVRERTNRIMEREIMENPTHWFVFVDFWDIEASRRLRIEGV
jgi:KDO2-lipid IV(A) lauroyltransferase